MLYIVVLGKQNCSNLLSFIYRNTHSRWKREKITSTCQVTNLNFFKGWIKSDLIVLQFLNAVTLLLLFPELVIY